MKRTLAFVAVCLGLGLASSTPGRAQPSGCPSLGIPCRPSDYCICSVTTNWIEGVDCDGDRTCDFHQGRFELTTWCSGASWYYGYDDRTVALFPVNGVGVYVRWRKARADYNPVLPDGQLIEPEPATTGTGVWQWDPAGFKENLSIYGLGYTWRYSSSYPGCGSHGCGDSPNMGWLSVTNPAYFGFRIPHAEGWHLGWMKLEWTGWTPDGFPLMRLAEYAGQPQPNTAIRAGERPRPPLSIALVAGRVRVSWPGTVAQVSNLLYRRFPTGRPCATPSPSA
jgi:hypothetical protein